MSGGHFNPAVTIGLLSAGKIDGANALGYIISHCLGGIAGALAIELCVPAPALAAVSMGTPVPGQGVSIGMALVTEIILTFFLMFVIYGTAVDSRAPKVGALFIGMAVTLAVLVGGPVRGAVMNPRATWGRRSWAGGGTSVARQRARGPALARLPGATQPSRHTSDGWGIFGRRVVA